MKHVDNKGARQHKCKEESGTEPIDRGFGDVVVLRNRRRACREG